MVSCELASAISNFFSTFSLLSWICAQLPQIYTNYTTKSADGISPLFLLLWFMGDFLSFTSCLINEAALGFQVYLSLFFICNDITLCYQYYYYNSVYPRVSYRAPEEAVTTEAEPHLTEAITFRLHVPENERLPLSSSESSSYSSIHNTKLPSKVTVAAAGAVLNAGLSNAMSTSGEVHTASTKDILALFLAWGCTVVYVSSRCPQLYKNYRRKSVEGMSPLLFGAALLGNLTYTVSILTSCQFLFSPDKLSFLWHQLPYILGSSGTVVFDFAYFYQRHIYRGRRSDEMDLQPWMPSI